MKELAVIAMLIALGYGTESSIAYVLGEACRVFEESPNENKDNHPIIVVAAIPEAPMNSAW